MNRKILVEKGQRFGYLTVIKEIYNNKRRRFQLQCDCGNITDVSLSHLRNNKVKSCGCLRHKTKTNYSHGFSKTRFYHIFFGIKARCNNIQEKAYKYYGGRGIKNEWNSFEEFKNDMYESYLKHCEEFGEKQTTIDRIDTNGNYSKENCRWATFQQQMRNRRITIKYNDINLIDFANKYNIRYKTLFSRIKYSGMSINEAIYYNKNKKINQYDLNENLIYTWNTVSEVEKNIGICHQNIIKVCQGKRKTAGGYIWKYL